jgi:glycosyltransferase involved in cell wall biosynthesis
VRVLIQVRPDHRSLLGGDAMHAERTAAALRDLGVAVDLSGELAPNLAPYDLVHVFNTLQSHAPFRQVTHARSAGLPLVLTPIYWDLRPLFEDMRSLRQEDDLGESPLERFLHANDAFVLAAADLLLPNSEAEAKLIADRFPRLAPKVRVVLSGVDHRFAQGDGKRFCERYGLEARAFVLCAERLEHRKNQLRLIEACQRLGLPLVLAGPEMDDYGEHCRRLVASSATPVYFLGQLAGPELADAYAAARVHAQPSHFEQIGRSSLEAALGGCNIVSTANCGLRDYLGDAAWYCVPTSVESIQEAVAEAYAAPLRAEVGRQLMARCTWDREARQTLSGYGEVLDKKRAPGKRGYWLPDMSGQDYIAELESLVLLQLEAMAFQDAQLRALRDDQKETLEVVADLKASRAWRLANWSRRRLHLPWR